jgi:hypothetical protein
MKTPLKRNLVSIGAFALAGAAYAQVPSTNDTSDSNHNTGTGSLALSGPAATLTGEHNTGVGFGTLYNITSGTGNTAVGSLALELTTTGIYNTGVGYEALYGDQAVGSAGSLNTAVGTAALFSYSTASNNTALGYETLFSTTTGNDNTASGYYALYYNTTGSYNVASGYQALFKNKVGGQNTAYGANALNATNTGFNTGIGYEALYKNVSGKYNIAVGWEAGSALTTGSNNIDIGNVGVAGESDTIRIGTATQTTVYIPGISINTSVNGSYVVVDSNGQLGTTSTPPSAALKSAYTPRLHQEMQQQAAQIRELQEQLSELKTLNQIVQVALHNLQAQNDLVAQR